MLTDYQISRIRAFTDSVRAGFCVFPEEQMLELSEILDACTDGVITMQATIREALEEAYRPKASAAYMTIDEWNQAADQRLVP